MRSAHHAEEHGFPLIGERMAGCYGVDNFRGNRLAIEVVSHAAGFFFEISAKSVDVDAV